MDQPPYTSVTFNLPYALPFEGDFGFEWADETFWVRIESVSAAGDRMQQVTGWTAVGAKVTIPGRHGLTQISKIEVRFSSFPVESNVPLLGQIDVGECREIACKGINRLVDVYRHTTGDFATRRVMPDHDVISLNAERVEGGGKGARGGLFGWTTSLVYPVGIRAFDEVRSSFDAALQGRLPIAVWQEYTLEARRFFEEREFASAIVLLNTALEVVWASYLRWELESQAVPESEVRKRVAGWLAGRGILARLDKETKSICGRSLAAEQPTLWSDVRGARDLRKNVIHPWIKRPTAEETLRGMVALESAISWILGLKSGPPPEE